MFFQLSLLTILNHFCHNLPHGVPKATPQQQALIFQNMESYFRKSLLICSELPAFVTTLFTVFKELIFGTKSKNFKT
jgi:hypothetical protein